MTEKNVKERGAIFWLAKNLTGALLRFTDRHWIIKVVSLIFAVLAVVFVFITRAAWQPIVLEVRLHTPQLFFGLLLWIVMSTLWRSRLRKAFWIIAVLTVVMFGLVERYNLDPVQYITLYLRYKSLDLKELSDLPETDHERVQPLHSIRMVAGEKITIAERASDPNFVRVGKDQYRFTMAIEPSYNVPRLFGNIQEIFNLSATSPALDFSTSREKVQFAVGEGLLWGKSAHVNVINTFGLFKFLGYKPTEVRYITDDSGAWVEVIPLIRYTGLFPHPEFGGVQIIHQSSGGFWHSLKSLFVGDGYWIRPRDIGKFPYLRGQNLIPTEVSRFMAESFKFQGGILAPLPGFHSGDLRVPDLPGDQNDQPYVTYDRFTPGVGDGNKLYHYFALQAFQKNSEGLNTSLFVPADGIGQIGVYRHSERQDGLTGITAVDPMVRDSQPMFDWSSKGTAEHRPFIRKIDSKTRFFWLSTVVTYKDANGKKAGDFIAGTIPLVALTDASSRKVVWVDADKPKEWAGQVEKAMGSIWK